MRVEAGGVPVTLVCSRAVPKGCRQRFVDGRLKPHDVGLAISLLHFLRIESLKLLDDRPVRQHISGQVDFMFGAVDKPNVDMFEVFRRRVVNYGRGIGAARRERGEQEDCGQEYAQQAQRDSSRP